MIQRREDLSEERTMSETTPGHTHGRAVMQGLAPEARALRQMIPSVYEGFVEFLEAKEAGRS